MNPPITSAGRRHLERLLTPAWAPLAVGAGVAIFSALGWWQLDRGAEKREQFAAFAAGGTGAPRRGLVADADGLRHRYVRLELTGRYDPDHQVLLDNMPEQGRPGYHVLTPFLTPAGAVLVNRGWIPAPGRREELPAIPVDGGQRRITGRIDRLPRPGVMLASQPPARDAPWPRRLFFPDAAGIGAQLGYPVRNFQLLLDRTEPDGYRREWRPAEFGPERHLGYAVQWFGLAAAVVVTWLVLALRRTPETPP